MVVEFTSEHVSAARKMARWTSEDLATAAGVEVSTIEGFENASLTLTATDRDAISRAFEHINVVFTATGPTVYGVFALYYMMEDDGGLMVFHYRQELAAAVQEIVGTFGTIVGEQVELSMEQRVTPELRTAIDGLVARYGTALPQLNKLKQKIGRVPDGKYFLLTPGEPASTKDRVMLENHLHSLNHPDAPLNEDASGKLFGLLLEQYDMLQPRTDRTTVIGVGKKPRTCRFCYRTSSETSFKKVAHIIPTALGNDHLKSAEECDECNEYFGRQTEPSLIAMLDVQRVFLGIQGRGKNNGRPTLKFGGDTLFHDGQKVVMEARGFARPDSETLEVTLGNGARLAPMEVYRALVKIVLSVIDEVHLPHLRKTIEWVRHGQHADQPIPTVAHVIIDLPPDPSAQITIYTRRVPHPRLPHVIGEFRLGCYLFAFAVPFSTLDHWDLVGFFDDADFKSTFKHYSAVTHWSQQDLSGTESKTLSARLRFVTR